MILGVSHFKNPPYIPITPMAKLLCWQVFSDGSIRFTGLEEWAFEVGGSFRCGCTAASYIQPLGWSIKRPQGLVWMLSCDTLCDMMEISSNGDFKHQPGKMDIHNDCVHSMPWGFTQDKCCSKQFLFFFQYVNSTCMKHDCAGGYFIYINLGLFRVTNRYIRLWLS